MRQNCTILGLPPAACDIDPRNSWTETSCPVSSSTSRLAAASASSFALSLPFGSTQALSLRNRTIAMSGSGASRTTIPPAARTGLTVLFAAFMAALCRTGYHRASVTYLRQRCTSQGACKKLFEIRACPSSQDEAPQVGLMLLSQKAVLYDAMRLTQLTVSNQQSRRELVHRYFERCATAVAQFAAE